MATNKTIQPTNVTVQIPAMADKPNQSVNSNCLDKIIDGVNALNSKIAMKDSYIEQPSAISHNFTVANNSSNILFMDGNGSTRLYAAFIYKASGNITVKPYFENTNFTITVNNNTLTIASADGTSSFPVYARIINIRGTTIS